MGGAALSFSGKGRFLCDHGYGETWGRAEWEQAGVPPGELSGWGLFDSALFNRARVALSRLHASGQPFNLTLLTVDTHNPAGFLSPDCRRQGVVEFQGIVSCSAREIADFIWYARMNGYLEDTTVVVIGDHLAPSNSVHDVLVKAPRRGMFNLFVGDHLPAASTRELLPFDLFPTLVELAGIDVNGDRLGLGYSAVGDVDTENADERADDWSLGALRGSSRYDALWSSSSQVELPAQD
jgi:phosphoglycerol transferase